MKFGRYLAENLTPEWKRAYIDYRACKKAIKVVGTRLGQVKEREGDGGDSDASSGADEDHGPSAPPKTSSSGRTPGSASGAGSLASPTPGTAGAQGNQGGTPRLGRFPSRPSEARSPQSTRYGSTGQSPRPLTRRTTNPPPLDLGEPHLEDRFASPTSPDSGADDEPKLRKGKVTFNHESEDGTPGSPDDSPQSSTRSSEEGQENSDSAKPLRGGVPPSPGRSRSNLSPRLFGKSPRFATFSPGISGLPSPRVQNSPKVDASPKQGGSPKVGRSPRMTPKTFNLRSPALSRFRSGSTVRSAETFEELYASLEPDEQAFFDLLEHELEKVEKFYVSREQEAVRRAHDLRDQLRELAEHRKLYHELYPEGIPEWEAKVGRMLPTSAQVRVPAFAELRARLKYVFNDEGHHKGDHTGSNGLKNGHANGTSHGADSGAQSESRSRSPVMDDSERQTLREAMAADKDHQTYSPERYQKYKKELRTAVLDFYRHLELIKNYRIMNLTGFRKALKKFEKTTKINCMEMYTDEKIAAASFSKGDLIEGLIKQVEELYTIHFEHGDSKRARDKLRRQMMEQTHYTTVLRSGIMLGLALPAAVAALIESSRAETRAAIPAWGGLLQVYAGLYLPVIFAMLFELNLDAYVSARINYEFVMELTKPTIDFRSYFEIPTFLFLTLSYCFYFSFARIGSETISPTTWPAAWLVFLAVFFLNPLPILRRPSRYWLLRVLFRVCTPGYSRVEFIAFFLADELNSLIYSIQNIYFLSCAYAKGWPGNLFDVCPSGKSWPYALLLCLPALSRLIQCLKRWHDSQLKIHLINAGKYSSVILQQCLFVYWRSQGSKSNNKSFIVWVLVATASSAYTCSWDIIIDWSLLRPHAGLLRKDLGYSRRYVYYFAMVSNFLIRFVFIWYIPYSQTNVRLRSFFFALAEMLRRWQWNFFRVETEHLGNADAYRVTREIPLPYRRIEHDSSEDESSSLRREKSRASRTQEQAGSTKSNSRSQPGKISVHLDKLRNRFHGRASTGGGGGGRGPDELDAGPRGHAGQREYEARRPGDRTPASPASPLTPSAVAGGGAAGTEEV